MQGGWRARAGEGGRGRARAGQHGSMRASSELALSVKELTAGVGPRHLPDSLAKESKGSSRPAVLCPYSTSSAFPQQRRADGAVEERKGKRGEG